MAETVSRQRLWQRRQIRKGNCMVCGKPRGDSGSAQHCMICLRKRRLHARAWQRKRHGYKPWHPGGRGHAPLDGNEGVSDER